MSKREETLKRIYKLMQKYHGTKRKPVDLSKVYAPGKPLSSTWYALLIDFELVDFTAKNRCKFYPSYYANDFDVDDEDDCFGDIGRRLEAGPECNVLLGSELLEALHKLVKELGPNPDDKLFLVDSEDVVFADVVDTPLDILNDIESNLLCQIDAEKQQKDIRKDKDALDAEETKLRNKLQALQTRYGLEWVVDTLQKASTK